MSLHVVISMVQVYGSVLISGSLFISVNQICKPKDKCYVSISLAFFQLNFPRANIQMFCF